MSDLQPLLDRDRYTDEEWEYASSGRCGWADAQFQWITRCGDPSSPDSVYRYCSDHDDIARDYHGYGR